MGRRDDDSGDRAAFAEAMKGVVPLADRDKALPPPAGKSRARAPDPLPPVAFDVTVAGERIDGIAAGIDRRHLRRLRSGAVRVEARADLHGCEAGAAREAVRETLLAAAAAGRRCVLVIHGRGLHSGGDPVLKRALPGWLTEPPLDRWVMAFATATPRDGGAGATAVLLRRRAVENAR